MKSSISLYLLRIVALFTISLTFSFNLCAQEAKIHSLISNGDWDAAYSLINKTISKHDDNSVALFYLAYIETTPNCNYYNPDSAYKHLWQAKKFFNLEKNKEKMKKYGLTFASFRSRNDSICSSALADAQEKDDIAAYKHFISYYLKAPDPLKKIARNGMQEAAYRNAQEIGTEAAYRNYLKAYPHSIHSAQAWEYVYNAQYQNLKNSQDIDSLSKYLKKFPRSSHREHIERRIDSLQYVRTVHPGDWETYRDFLNLYPQNSFYAVAEDTIYNTFLRETDYDSQLELMEYGATYFSGSKRTIMLKRYHDYICSDGDYSTISDFYEQYDDPIFDETRDNELHWAAFADSLDLYHTFDPGKTKLYDRYITNAIDKDLAFVAIQRIISPHLARGDEHAAITTLKHYREMYNDTTIRNAKLLDNLIALLSVPQNKKNKPMFLGDGVNTEAEEYSPVPTSDEKSLYFCGRYRKDCNDGGKHGVEDIFLATASRNGKFQNARLQKSISSLTHNDAPLCISSDGNTLLLFRDGVIGEVKRLTNGSWSTFSELPAEVNMNEWQSDAWLAPDGNAVLFAAESPDNYNTNTHRFYHGEYMHASDIYVVYRDTVSQEIVGPINLGPVINTRYSDRSPCLTSDGMTLYFSSNGHGGFGHRDIFVSHRLNPNSWTEWSEPQNLGIDINTEGDEGEFRINYTASRLYYHHVGKHRNIDIFYKPLKQ